jgi:predicted glycosyltransferase
MMKIWYDACTGKHVRYGAAIAKRLRSSSHEVILTIRAHPDTAPLIEFLGEQATVIGKYDPRSLLTRLKEGLNRQRLLCDLFKESIPDVAISHGSVDLCRVAFGLGIPIVTTMDTPYADAVHRLTIPLSKFVVASKAIPRKLIQFYSVDAQTVSFDGVDEIAWIKGFTPRVRYDFGEPLIVVRDSEVKASYAKERISLVSVAKTLTRLGKVVFLSRYDRKESRGLIVPKGFVDSASLVAQADLFIGVGGTITREAALQGTPSIVIKLFSDQYVNDYLAKKGFPIYTTSLREVPRLAKKLIGRKHNVKNKLAKLENPVDVISRIVNIIGND